MPINRDGRNVLTVHPSEPPPAVPPGPIERSQASAARMADFAAEAAAVAEKRRRGKAPTGSFTLDPTVAAEARRRAGEISAGRAATKPQPTNGIHHDAGSLRARAQVDEGKRAMSESQIQTDPASDPIPRPRGDRLVGARDALLAQRRSTLTPRQAEVIDKLRELGSRRAVQEALGAKHLQSIDGTLLDAHAKGLLPADLPDLPKRIRAQLPSPAGLTAAEHRRAMAAAEAAHRPRSDSAPESQRTPPLEEPVAPLGLPEMAAAVDRALAPDFTPRPIEGEDRCSFARVLTTSGILHVCDRPDGHEGLHRGRMLSVRVTDQVASLLGYTVAVPA